MVSQEFKFIELDDAFSTGSSMMPQKKNPDMAELIRGKTGRVYGNLMGLIDRFERDCRLRITKTMQEDKEGVFDTVKTIVGSPSNICRHDFNDDSEQRMSWKKQQKKISRMRPN